MSSSSYDCKPKKILMTTMSLDIGGAETHIAELSRALVAHGHDVTVASGGGVYVESFERAGVKHVTLPLYSKNPLKVIQCYRALKKLIAEERFDVVHAHARIPAAICGALAKRMGFRFATTAHYNFDVSPLWRLASNWGEKSLAVSYDLKEYLIKNYDVPSDNIALTVNGIDIDRFRADAEHDELIEEFHLPKSDHRVLYVSRFDRSCVQAGFDLIDATKQLAPHYPDLTVVMVGAGDAQERVRELAEQVNRALGREAIILAGARTDIDRFCGWANYFVGVSRSALEAMSAGCPTILAGAQGSLGIFRAQTLARALDTNFTCRGFDLMDGAAIAGALTELFEMSEQERADMGAYNRAIVAEHYSIDRMARDAEQMYDSLMPAHRYKYGDIVISGYYGYSNLGDDSLLRVIIDRLRENNPDVRITVLSHRPKRTAREYLVRSVGRFRIFAVRRALKHANLLIFGGGSQLQSVTSSRSLFYYLFLLRSAQKMGLKTVLFANGIGPFGSMRDERRVAQVLSHADLITLRDDSSLEKLAQMGVSCPNIFRSADPTFTMQEADSGWCDHLLRRVGMAADEKFFVISLRAWKHLDPDVEDKLVRFCRTLSERIGCKPLFIPMQSDRDLKLCRAICDRTNGRLLNGLSPTEARTIVGRAQLVCGMRLHLLIYAVTASVPAVALSYDPKIDTFFADLGCPWIMNAEHIDVDTLLRFVEQAQNTDRSELVARAEGFRERAVVSTCQTVKLLQKAIGEK